MDKISKKSQSTIFIILGLLILLAGGLFIIISMNSAKKPFVEELPSEDAVFSGESELDVYMQQCIKPAVIEGLEIMRLQGGFIDIPDSVQTMTVKDRDGKVVKEIEGSKKVVIDPSAEGNQVPYWILKDELNVPPLEVLQDELAGYVTDEAVKCIDDFRPFRRQNYEVSYGQLNVDVQMDKAVVVNVGMPINMKKGDTEFDESKFVFKIPVNMRLIHDMAYNLTAYEYHQNYLEEHTKSLISLYSNIDKEKLPPFGMSYTNLDCSQVTWQKSDVKDKLKRILETNVAHLHIKNTDFELPQTDDEVSKGVYESFIYDFFGSDLSNTVVKYSYRSDWDFMEYDILPRAGDEIKPNSYEENKIPFIGSICVFDYSYKYTLDYPVFVEIEDKDSALLEPLIKDFYENKGYRFQFLMDSYICGNQGRECTAGVSIDDKDVTLLGVAGKPLITDDGTKISAGTRVSSLQQNLGVNFSQKSYFCEPEQRISGDIEINVYDSLTRQELPDVGVYYWCGNNKNDCFVGKTDSKGYLKTRFPYCLNGIIYLSKKGYPDYKEKFSVNSDEDIVKNFYLAPEKNFSVEVMKIHLPTYVKNYADTGSLDISDAVREIGSQEKSMISGHGEENFNIIYPLDKGLKLSAMEYDLNMMLLGKVNVAETDFGAATAREFSGDYILGQTNLAWNVRNEDLRKRNVLFLVFTEKDPSEILDWRDIGDPINQEGELSAELLYQCQKVITDQSINEFYCDWTDCDFVDIDGTNSRDFQDDLNNCKKVKLVNIKKGQYQRYIMPRFS